MVESVDRFILAMPSLVNKSKRQLFAVVRERQQLADGLARLLGQLGLARVEKPVAWEYADDPEEETTPRTSPGPRGG